MSSGRFPSKVLEDLGVRRVQRARNVDALVVATRVDPSRYAQGAAIYDVSVVVRLTGDCPLIDPTVVDAVIAHRVSYDQVEEVDEKRFNRYINLGISAEDMFVRLGGKVGMEDPRQTERCGT